MCNDTFKRPSSTPEFGAGRKSRNDLRSYHFDAVRYTVENLSRGYLSESMALLPTGGMSTIYPKTWRDAEGVRIHSRYGRPVLYEYKDGKMVLQTSYPSKAITAYMEGDVILIQKPRKRDVEKLFPRLKEASSGFSVLRLILLFIGFEEPKYTIGERITMIDPFTNRVTTEAMIRLGGVWVEIGGRNSWKGRSETSLNIVWYRRKTLDNVVWFAGGVEVSTIFIATLGAAAIGRKVGEKIAKYVGKEAAKRGFKKIFSELLQKALLTTAKCSAKFVVALAKDLETKNSLADLQEKLGKPVDGRNVVQISLIKVSSEFSNCLVETLFESAATKHIPGFIGDILGDNASMVKKKVAGAITKELIKLPTTTFFSTMNTAITKAIADSRNGKGSFDTQLNKNLVKGFEIYISSKGKDLSSSIADTLAESF